MSANLSSGVLAVVVRTERTYVGGDFVDYDVCDSRSGEALATRSELESAAEVAEALNAMYTPSMAWPAHDSLVHEIVGLRIAPEPPMPLEATISYGNLRTTCPPYVPVGPGWDHLYTEAS